MIRGLEQDLGRQKDDLETKCASLLDALEVSNGYCGIFHGHGVYMILDFLGCARSFQMTKCLNLLRVSV